MTDDGNGDREIDPPRRGKKLKIIHALIPSDDAVSSDGEWADR
jgi:hypothetical protein